MQYSKERGTALGEVEAPGIEFSQRGDQARRCLPFACSQLFHLSEELRVRQRSLAQNVILHTPFVTSSFHVLSPFDMRIDRASKHRRACACREDAFWGAVDAFLTAPGERPGYLEPSCKNLSSIFLTNSVRTEFVRKNWLCAHLVPSRRRSRVSFGTIRAPPSGSPVCN